jgi:hypothetical protein
LERDCGKFWPCGTENIEVCAEWGIDMPDAIKKAVAIMVWESLQPGSTGLVRPSDVSRVDWEDFSISYSNDAASSDEVGGTGISAVDQLIFPYYNHAGSILFGIGNKCCSSGKCGCKEGCNH